jgi:inorganic pyrophosphatase
MRPDALPLTAKDHPTWHHLVIEAVRGSRNKYKYDPKLDVFALSKVLPLGSAFPLDFGFFPSTKGEDGDPLDGLVLAEETGAVGTVVTVVLLGVIEAEQTEERKTIRNDRVIGALVTEKNAPRARKLDVLTKDMREEIEHFFVSYNEVEGRKFRVLAWRGAATARRLLAQGMKRALPQKR